MNARREAKHRASQQSFKGTKLQGLTNRMFAGYVLVCVSYGILSYYTEYPKGLKKFAEKHNAEDFGIYRKVPLPSGAKQDSGGQEGDVLDSE